MDPTLVLAQACIQRTMTAKVPTQRVKTKQKAKSVCLTLQRSLSQSMSRSFHFPRAGYCGPPEADLRDGRCRELRVSCSWSLAPRHWCRVSAPISDGASRHRTWGEENLKSCVSTVCKRGFNETTTCERFHASSQGKSTCKMCKMYQN